jgi:phosphoglucomutase
MEDQHWSVIKFGEKLCLENKNKKNKTKTTMVQHLQQQTQKYEFEMMMLEKKQIRFYETLSPFFQRERKREIEQERAL